TCQFRLQALHAANNLVSDDFIFETLSAMEHLRELDVGYAKLDLKTLLNRTPQLERLKVDKLFKMLHRMPGLEKLRINGLSYESPCARSARPFSVTTFEIDDSFLRPDQLLAFVVGQFPRLVSIQIPKIRNGTMEALWNHCYHLE
ncbi:hypothetical protein BGX29_002194, partial [Mortierella sp. GBA35]